MNLNILDPPTFSNSKKMADVLRHSRGIHGDLLRLAMPRLAKGGELFFVFIRNNYRRFILA